jgi:Guanosine polyphosphate pyrophosphohydrolases/synthetases
MKVDKVMVALGFAAEAHTAQVRKYTGEPYINHPVEVMNIVKSVPHTEDMLCAALLHDVVEDCGVTLTEIFDIFGAEVCYMVNDLSDFSCPEDGNRAKRKAIDRLWIGSASSNSKTIKLADLISNSKSILEHDKDFAKVYIKEKELLLEVLTEGDPTLYAEAKDIVEKAKKELGID